MSINPKISRRSTLGLAGLALAAPALSQSRFPAHPVKLFVPWSAGSSSDVQMRSLAEAAQQTLGQPVVIENRTGGGGTLHVQPLATAKPDGYTVGQMHLSIVRRPFMMRQAPWNAVTDFTHILRLCGWMYGLAVKADSPYRTWQEFMADARANPHKLTYATSGIGTTNHLAMEDLQKRENVELTHVPYRGTSDGVTAVLSGEVSCIADASAWAPHVEGGQMRVLSVWNAERVQRFPNVPTLKELGHDVVVTSPYGISGPKGMDPAVVRVLHDAFKTALFSQSNVTVRNQFDMPEQYLDTAQYTAFISERSRYEQEMVQRLNLRID